VGTDLCHDRSGGGGGGGSGGAIYIYAPFASLGGTLQAVGGAGGFDGGTQSHGQQGNGGLGRIRLSIGGASAGGGRFNPPLQNGLNSANSSGFTYIAPWPN